MNIIEKLEPIILITAIAIGLILSNVDFIANNIGNCIVEELHHFKIL